MLTISIIYTTSLLYGRERERGVNDQCDQCDQCDRFIKKSSHGGKKSL